ncbi:hypothetical protein BX659_12627 [Orenia metallireducens]|uniref:Uncharacterized protein n=1 Tax=Orenia metallireducens TaxID=1413210 RepID=A0A285I272_9FIRM|nr:hypothetical protein [Orenia metallireducens]PRX23248.1 hypothetical protein BX659_12627 [Orenia metallireducens]SNY42082.1 hypothetical protein SAMN06265827_12927 [Orenia metallireducens]
MGAIKKLEDEFLLEVDDKSQVFLDSFNSEVDYGLTQVFSRCLLEKDVNRVKMEYKRNLQQCNKVEFVNCTPHQIRVLGDNNKVLLDLKGIKNPARVSQKKEEKMKVGGVPVITKNTRIVSNLPSPRPGIIYIVSGFVKNTLNHRMDLVAPDTCADSVVKDGEGKIVGVRRLIK